jgi:hypothetical protein
MKSILISEGRALPDKATARNLIRRLQDEGYIYPFLEDFENSFINILQGLGTIRNKLSTAHGAGIDIKKVESSYAEFALHLAGSFNLFCNQEIFREARWKVSPLSLCQKIKTG